MLLSWRIWVIGFCIFEYWHVCFWNWVQWMILWLRKSWIWLLKELF